MDKPEIQAITDDVAAMAKIVSLHQGDDPAIRNLQERHPVTMDELRALKPKIEELEHKGVDLHDYTVVGVDVVLANFEGNFANGTHEVAAIFGRKLNDSGPRQRHQPWWMTGIRSIYFM
ncbi:MAG: hypothetical protein WDM70_04365 [Nitrosomonadales bacterium]